MTPHLCGAVPTIWPGSTGNPCGQNYAAGDAAVRRSFCLNAPAVESGVPTAGAIGGRDV